MIAIFIAESSSSPDKRISFRDLLHERGERAEAGGIPQESHAGLLGDRQWITLDSIRPGAMVVRNVTLSVPDQYNHEIKVALWGGDVIVEHGLRAMFLAPNTTKERGGMEYTTRKVRTPGTCRPYRHRSGKRDADLLILVATLQLCFAVQG